MNCPACGKTLVEHQQAGLTVDVCDQACGGIWFDDFELQKVDEAHESKGEALLDIGLHTSVTVDHARKRACPKCASSVMRRFYFSVRREVEIDECPACGGVWLDTGELAAIRKEFNTEAKRKQAADEYFTQLFDKQLQTELAKSQAELARAKKFAHALRFLCPSYWIPGKQTGGAF